MNKERSKTSFLGDIIFIIILVIAIYLAMNILANNEFKKIELINEKYGVTQNNLLPANQAEYISELSALNNTKYTKPIIDYINLNEESIKLNNLVNYGVLTNEGCISKKLQLKVTVFTQKQDMLLTNFESINAPKLEKIYWNQYISKLKNTNDYRDAKTEIIKKQIC